MCFDQRREFCRRQALRLIEHAENACDEETACILLEVAGYWLDQLEVIERTSRQCGQSSPMQPPLSRHGQFSQQQPSRHSQR